LKLHLDRFEGLNAFTGYGDDYVAINGRTWNTSVVVFPDRPVEPWPVTDPARIDADALDFLTPLPLEIVLIGTGQRHHLLHPRTWAPLAAARIGVEVMDTRAACRTYNILLAEGRKVATTLILGVGPR
jgi:uncharacterized protein